MDLSILTAKILLIEDDGAFAEQAQAYFEDNGFTLIIASDGQIGLEKVRSEKPEAVVINLQTPPVNGLEILKTLTHEYPSLPVLAISEATELKEVIQALRMGAWDYLTKPIPAFSVLEHAICRALERSRLIEENRIYKEKLEEANQALKKSLAILEADQQAGRSVQMKLLPSAQWEINSLHFAHHVAPSLYLSGDFVDYFKIDDQSVGFYIADVSGHGASSAFVTVLLKSAMAQILTRFHAGQDTLIKSPNQVLEFLAKEIYSAKLGKYLTMIYGILDLETRNFSYSIGGHYPNPLLLEGNQARFLEGKGFPVGIMGNTHYSLYQTSLEKGFRLMFFSDGIAEILPEKDMSLKEARLLSLAKEGQASLTYFIQALDLENKAHLPDDVTLLTLSDHPAL